MSAEISHEPQTVARRGLFLRPPTGPSSLREFEAVEYALDRSIRRKRGQAILLVYQKVGWIRHAEARKENCVRHYECGSCAPQSTLAYIPGDLWFEPSVFWMVDCRLFLLCLWRLGDVKSETNRTFVDVHVALVRGFVRLTTAGVWLLAIAHSPSLPSGQFLHNSLLSKIGLSHPLAATCCSRNRV
jgi:hypothetical protein